jgi:PleD family two-component response regulator
MREEIRSTPIRWQNSAIPLSSSFGCTSAVADGSVTACELIRIADEALYAAKRGGRDRVVATPAELEVLALN